MFGHEKVSFSQIERKRGEWIKKTEREKLCFKWFQFQIAYQSSVSVLLIRICWPETTIIKAVCWWSFKKTTLQRVSTKLLVSFNAKMSKGDVKLFQITVYISDYSEIIMLNMHLLTICRRRHISLLFMSFVIIQKKTSNKILVSKIVEAIKFIFKKTINFTKLSH